MKRYSGIHRFVSEVVVAYRESYISIRWCCGGAGAGGQCRFSNHYKQDKNPARQGQQDSIHPPAHHSGKSKTAKSASRSRGQRGIDEQRTLEIQNALIKEHYLTGEPSGTWDAATRDAMTRYQAANGWQTKLTPDSRALIKLGLGPDHKGLLNPETANIPSPHELGVDSETQPGGSTEEQ